MIPPVLLRIPMIGRLLGINGNEEAKVKVAELLRFGEDSR